MIAGAETFRAGDQPGDGRARPQRPGVRGRAAEAPARGQRPLLRAAPVSRRRLCGDGVEFENALGEYAAAGLINPRSAAPALSAARAYLRKAMPSRALQKADEAAAHRAGQRRHPDGAGADLRARPAGHQRQSTSTRAAMRDNPSDPQARARLASLAMRTKLFDAAQPQFEALLRMGYRPSRMHFGLAQIAEAKGDLTRARGRIPGGGSPGARVRGRAKALGQVRRVICWAHG